MFEKRDQEFIKFVKSECDKYGVKCDLRDAEYVVLTGNIKCSGWFDMNYDVVMDPKIEKLFFDEKI